MTALIWWPAAHGGALLAIGCAGAVLAFVGLAGAGLARAAGPRGAMPAVPPRVDLLDADATHPRGVRVPAQPHAREVTS